MDYYELIQRLEFMVENPQLSQATTSQIFTTLREQADRIKELEPHLTEAQPLIELGIQTQQEQELAQMELEE